MIRVLLLAGSLFFAESSVLALSRGQTGADFLKLPNGVRAVAMGSSFVAVAEDIYSVFWNPSGIALLEAPEFAGSYVRLFDRVEGVSQVSAAVEVPRFPFEAGNSCFGFVTLTTGEFDSTDPDMTVKAAAGSASDGMIFYSFGAQATDSLIAGISVKLIRRGLAGPDSETFAVDPLTGDSVSTRAVNYQAYGAGLDIGAMWISPDRALSYGAALQNLGTIGPFRESASLSFWRDSEMLPAQVRVGASLRSRLWGSSLLTSMDVHSLVESMTKPSLSAGFEYGVSEIAFLRLGWDQPLDERLGKTALDFGSTSGLASLPSPLRTGVGIRWRTGSGSVIQFDYALAPFGTLGTVHHAAMLVRWNIPTAPRLVEMAIPGMEKRAKQTLTIEPKQIELKESVKEWKVEITDEGGRVVKTFAGKGMPPKSLDWDGTDERGNLLTGVRGLEFVLKARDVRNRLVKSTSAIGTVEAEPRFKAVGGRQLYPEVYFLMPSGDFKSWQLRMEDAGKTVKVWEGIGRPESRIVWDGKDERGNAVTFRSPRYAWRLEGHEGQAMSGTKPLGEIEADMKAHLMENSVRMVGIRFTGRSVEITREHLDVVEKAARFVAKHPQSSLIIESYADFPGSDEENYEVAKQRAEKVLRTAVERYRLEAPSVTLRVFGRSRTAPSYQDIPAGERHERVDIVIRARR